MRDVDLCCQTDACWDVSIPGAVRGLLGMIHHLQSYRRRPDLFMRCVVKVVKIDVNHGIKNEP